MKIARTAIFAVLIFCMSYNAEAQHKDLPWGIGIHPSAFSFFTLDQTQFTGDSKNDFGLHFSFAKYLNKSFNAGLETSFGLIKQQGSLSDIEEGQLARENFYSVHPFMKFKINNGAILKEELWIGPYLKGGLGINKSASADGLGTYLPIAFGINFRLGEIAAFEVQTTYNFGLSNTEDYFQSSLGLIIHFKGKSKKSYKEFGTLADTDEDGIPDIDDKCPNLKGDQIGKGCPDQDGDGIFDDNDDCPTVPGYANLMGCIDSDNDGLTDIDDRCPNAFGPMHNEGCPLNDKDGDKIEDAQDECPDEPGLFTTKGCPDSDGDGIKDSDDKCPEKYGDASLEGCPPKQTGSSKVFVPGSQIYVGQQDLCSKSYVFLGDQVGGRVRFASNSATILSSSYETLDRVVEILNRCATHNLLVTAHTDSDGDTKANMKLSSKRADAVKKYLVSAGLTSRRVKTAAFGESQPIAPNDTAENKAKNRRVEFTLFQ